MPSRSESATAHAAAAVGRAMTWKRIPKRSVRPAARRQAPHPLDPVRDHGRRLTPGEVHVHVTRGDLLGCGGGAPEVDLGHRVRWLASRRVRHLVVMALEGQRLPAPGPADDLQELTGLLVPGVLVVVHAEAGQLGGLGPGDDVDQQPAAGQPLVRRCHLRGEGRREQRGSERNEELDPTGQRDERRGGEPGVLTAGATGGEHPVVAEAVAGGGDLGEVREVRGSGVRVRRRREDVTRVTSGRQEPVDPQHADHLGPDPSEPDGTGGSGTTQKPEGRMASMRWGPGSAMARSRSRVRSSPVSGRVAGTPMP